MLDHGEVRIGSNGSYKGELKNNEPSGPGVMRSEDGRTVSGIFERGKPVGAVDVTWPNGVSYHGQFVCSLRDDQGTLRATGPDGPELVYDGAFKSGVIHGAGKLTMRDMKFDGEFKQGKFAGGQVHFTDGRTIEADLETHTFFEVKADGSKVPLDELPPPEPRA